METRPKLSGASSATLLTLSDLTTHTHEPTGITMSFEYTEQLLTPENSRSETSSNNENASNEENPTLRRRSTRVTRASLRGAAQLDINLEEDPHGPPSPAGTQERAVSDENPVNGIDPERKRSQSSRLRHSIAIMESSLQTETLLAQDNMEVDNQPRAPDTPISKSSQEPQLEDLNAALQPRTLRKRVEQALTHVEHRSLRRTSSTTKEDNQTPTRRSTRLSLLEKVSDLAGRATSVLGKRSSDGMEKAKETSRRSSLRPRQAAVPKEEPTTINEPPPKRRRISDSDIPSKPKVDEEPAQGETSPGEVINRSRTKRWLTHGLYTGQEYTNSRPSQNKNKNTKRKSLNPRQGKNERKLLPMPMFAGERLLQMGRDFQLPFDIYSPLPVGQPKPNEWRKTNKNVFVGEASSIWRANKPLELSKCMCTADTGCDEFCQNRYMFFECDDGNCGLGPECGNRNFEGLKQRTKIGGKYNIGVEVIKTEDRGYGVRSNRTFEPDQIIVEYTGEIITQTECEKRMRSVYKKNECYYLMYFDQNMIIDATRGSIARFVNHSCQPNCRMEKWTVAGKPRMALFAGDRGVMTGEELTYDYNFNPYSQKNVQQCRCGSSNCRGILGPRPKEKDQRAELRAAREKESANLKKAKAKAASLKRKLANSSKKKRNPLAPVKSGVKKAVSRARAAVSNATASQRRSSKPKATRTLSKKTTKKTARGTSKSEAKTKDLKRKDGIKLPKVKATKTQARAPARTKKPKKATASQTEKSPSKFKRTPKKTNTKPIKVVKDATTRKRSTQKKTDAIGASKATNKGSPKVKGMNKRTKASTGSAGRSPKAKKN